jgi:hypothetical protein
MDAPFFFEYPVYCTNFLNKLITLCMSNQLHWIVYIQNSGRRVYLSVRLSVCQPTFPAVLKTLKQFPVTFSFFMQFIITQLL